MAQATTATAHKPLFGGSINAVLMGQKPTSDDDENPQNEEFKPESGAKVEAKREAFLAELYNLNPRLANALRSMTIEGFTIRACVMTEMVRDELLRNRGEINNILREVCGIEGSMAFEIEVARSRDAKPVKAEDKLRFLVGRNPEVTNLIQALDLDLK